MGPKAPTATPTAPSFETPYLETILPDGEQLGELLSFFLRARERLCLAPLLSPPQRQRPLHPRRLVHTAEILLSSPFFLGVVG